MSKVNSRPRPPLEGVSREQYSSWQNKIANWNILTIIEELRKRSLCCLYKRGDKFKLVKILEQDDAGILAFQRLDPQTAISGLKGVPRSSTSVLGDEPCLVAQ